MKLQKNVSNAIKRKGFYVELIKFYDSYRDSKTGEILQEKSEPVKIKVIQGQFSKREIDGENIKPTDILFITGGEIKINDTDIISSNGLYYEIKVISEIAPMGEILLYKIRGRR